MSYCCIVILFHLFKDKYITILSKSCLKRKILVFFKLSLFKHNYIESDCTKSKLAMLYKNRQQHKANSAELLDFGLLRQAGQMLDLNLL